MKLHYIRKNVKTAKIHLEAKEVNSSFELDEDIRRWNELSRKESNHIWEYYRA